MPIRIAATITRRLPVESSAIRSLGYDPRESVLEVEFTGRKVWRFRGVSPEMYAEMLNAPSVGSFFAREIKGHYESEDMSEPFRPWRCAEVSR